MIVAPKSRGFICTTAHPVGCAAMVREQIEYITTQPKINNGPKRVLIIGASTGYGLASRITAAFGSNAATIGVFFEAPSSGNRTASAGWYNSVAFEKEAHKQGLYAKSINGDAFSHALKQQVIDLVFQDWGAGSIDCVIYSLAAPRRIHPDSGETFSSALKPIGQAYADKTVNFLTGKVSPIEIKPATEAEIAGTVKVMGGEDWQLWLEQLLEAKLLSDKATTLAYSYIGPELTYPIYWHGTIGRAKDDLEEKAKAINAKLATIGGRAYVSVNKALVTQASAAIPVVPLYISLLYKIMKEQGTHEGCIEQMYRLFADRLYSGKDVPLDSSGRIRIDELELDANVQDKIYKLWDKLNTENLSELSDIEGYRDEFFKLFGFNVFGVDYSKDVAVDLEVPSIEQVSV